MEYRIFALLAFLLGTVLTSNAQEGDLVLSGGVINTVNDFQVGHENWARVKFQVENKSNRTRKVKIQFRHALKPAGVYEYMLEVPAQRVISHQFPVAMGSASHVSSKDSKKLSAKEKRKKNQVNNSYVLTLLEKTDDRYLPVQSSKPVECVMDFKDLSSKDAIALLTDDPVQIGNLSKKLGYNEGHFRMTYVHQGRWPEHWSEYSPYNLVVILKPNYDGFNNLTVKALKNYVKMGGTILFAHHDGIKDAVNTPFEELLPVTPIAQRQVNHIPAVDKFFKTEKKVYAEFGMEFLETAAKPEAYTPLMWNEFPVVAWKKYGTGLVAAMTLAPVQSGFHETDGFKKVWKYFIANSSRPADMSTVKTEDARQAVNMLNGLTIPGPSIILSYLIFYLIAATVIFLILHKLNKTLIGWGVNILLAIGMTVFTFKKAYSSHSNESKFTAASFKQIPLVSEAPSVKIYSIFSKGNEEISLTGNMLNDRFRKLPKLKRKMSMNMNPETQSIQKQTVEQVIKGLYDGEKSYLNELQIQGLSSRLFAVMTHGSASSYQPANLNLTGATPVIDSKDFPAEISESENIYLAGESGVIVLELKDNALIQKKSQAVRGSLDEHLRKLLLNLDISRPTLFFSKNGIKEDDLLNESFSMNGLDLYMMPLKESFSGTVNVPGIFNKIEPTNSSLFIYKDGEWFETRHMGAKKGSYALDFQLPLGYSDINPEEIVVDFEYINGSGNVIVDLYVGSVKGEKGKDGRYRFKNLPPDTIVDGRISLTLETSVKVVLTDNLEAHQANMWKIKNIEVSVKGSFNNQQTASGF